MIRWPRHGEAKLCTRPPRSARVVRRPGRLRRRVQRDRARRLRPIVRDRLWQRRHDRHRRHRRHAGRRRCPDRRGGAGGGPPAADAGGYCGNQVHQVITDPPNLYFVFDVSGSMGDIAEGGFTKYELVEQGAVQMIENLGPLINFGAAIFPDGASSTNPCQVGAQVFPVSPGDPISPMTGPTTEGFIEATTRDAVRRHADGGHARRPPARAGPGPGPDGGDPRHRRRPQLRRGDLVRSRPVHPQHRERLQPAERQLLRRRRPGRAPGLPRSRRHRSGRERPRRRGDPGVRLRRPRQRALRLGARRHGRGRRRAAAGRARVLRRHRSQRALAALPDDREHVRVVPLHPHGPAAGRGPHQRLLRRHRRPAEPDERLDSG